MMMGTSLSVGLYPTTPFPLLFFFKTWHADGTEFENAFVPPAGGNICYGVWKDLGKGTVKLHHIGLMFNSDGEPLSHLHRRRNEHGRARRKNENQLFDFKLGSPAMMLVGIGKPIAEVKGSSSCYSHNRRLKDQLPISAG